MLPKVKKLCRNLVLVFFLLSLLDHASSVQNNQDGRFHYVDDSQWKKVTAVLMTDGNRYHSDYFNFTYRLPHRFIDRTEYFKNEDRAVREKWHRNPDTSDILLHAEKRPRKAQTPVGEITVTVDPLSRYNGITEKDFMHRTAKSMVFAGDDVLQEGKQVEVSGWNFFRADYKINHPNNGYLTVMVAFRNGFALLWQFSAHSKEEVDSITSLMPRQLITR